jgi:hypothetical protein
MNNMEVDSKNTIVYPFCYKIAEGCPPSNCDANIVKYKYHDNNIFDCIELLSNYMSINSSNGISQEEKDKSYNKIGMCLKRYGDIYDKLGIKPYVNPKTYAILFPNNERIQANYNLFLNDIGSNPPKTPTESDLHREKMELYQILLNEKLRGVYNDFYQTYGFSNIKSISPKNYGITEIMNSDLSGGKIKKRKAKKTKRKRKKNIKWRTKRSKRIGIGKTRKLIK